MADVAFYHVTQGHNEQGGGTILAALLQKTLLLEKRALVCCPRADLKRLSGLLWSYAGGVFGEGSWLAHGLSGVDACDASLCPIWLSDDAAENLNGAEFMFFLGVVPRCFEDKERVFILFDGGDGAAVSAAREQWKQFRQGGHHLAYWHQDDAGGWVQQG